ncbi:hypothetical protein [Polaromonas sp. SM01]|uniref:hypothetical protein n=1 Tax=Polaromonas sp. SM01 TaxID=3085630 RepID=UPI00298140B8|nr:hypothetical protein [Polaromonas sp. SM01]MDW5441148.1 hypothetical protein [Polaromonas sp. SM01]
MKTLLSLLAMAALSGCAVYPSAAYDTYDGSVVAPYGVVQPMYIYGGGLYPYGAYGAYGAYPLGYYRFHPGVFPHHSSQFHAPGAGHGARGGMRGGSGGSHRH